MTFSIVIPAFNRSEPLRYTLQSAADAAAELGEPVEILVVDDGSEPPLQPALSGFPPAASVKWIRQPNGGSISARLNGLASAVGEFVLFLDSDDLIAPEKLRRHAVALRAENADICYDDMAQATLGPDYRASYAFFDKLGRSQSIAEWALIVQPLPHNPTFRRSYLDRALASPLVRPDRRLDPAGDAWLYYNLLLHPARIAKVDLPLTAVGPHEEARYSQQWEKLGVAALHLAEAFMAACPDRPETAPARRVVGEAAFSSWRRLPRGFNREFRERLLALWRSAPPNPVERLGGPLFAFLARLVGPVVAGSILRVRSPSYARCRTVTDEELRALLLPR